MTDNPPPYPGINPSYQPGPQHSQGAFGGPPQANGYGFQQPGGSNVGFNIPAPSKFYGQFLAWLLVQILSKI
jgi:hypothetical protein